MKYGFKRQVDLNFDEAVLKVKSELSKEGFGILTEIDVRATLKKKLGIDYEDYFILGACNPPFAHKALEAEKDIGLLLPCNLIVYVDKGKTYVVAVDPSEVMSVVENEDLKQITEKVGEKLNNVVERI